LPRNPGRKGFFMKMNLKKGFTLIELLVVVAIIGILASVVLASLNSARAKGADAAAKADLANMRAQAALYYDSTTGNQTYGAAQVSPLCAATAGTLFADPNIAAAITQATAQSTAIACASTPQTYAMAVTLKSGAGYYCVDSAGAGVAKTLVQITGGIHGAGITFALNDTTGLCTP
jgi:prepilin-type N-terminal cleavage/methylation domain-containing protein